MLPIAFGTQIANSYPPLHCRLATIYTIYHFRFIIIILSNIFSKSMAKQKYGHFVMFFFFALLLISTKCTVNMLKDILTPTHNISFNMLNSVNVASTHLIGTWKSPNYSSIYYVLQLYFVQNSTHPEQYITMNTTIEPSLHMARSHPTNTYHYDIGGILTPIGIFLVLERKTTAKIGINQLITPITIYNTSYNQCISTSGNNLGVQYMEQIQDGRFLSESNEIILIIKTPLGYVLKYITFLLSNLNPNPTITKIGTTDILIPLTLINTTQNQVYTKKIQFNNISNKILISFSCAVLAYSADYLLQYHGYTLLPNNYTSMGWSDIDLSISEGNGDLIAIFTFWIVQIYNISTWNTLGSWKRISRFTSNGYESIFLNLPYLYLISYSTPIYSNISNMSIATLTQIDIQTNFNPSTNTYNGSIIQVSIIQNLILNSDIDILNGQMIIYHQNFRQYGIGYNQMLLMEMLPKYESSGNGSCLEKYQLVNDSDVGSGWSCLRGPSSFVSSSRASHPTYPFFQYSNITADSQPSIQLDLTQPLDLFCYIIAKALPLTTIKSLPQFLSSLTILLDDLWYYRFHNTTYPKKAQFFLEKVNLINEIRLILKKKEKQGIDAQNEFQKTLVGYFRDGSSPFQPIIDKIPAEDDQLYILYLPKTGKKYVPDSTYFMNSASDIYISQLLLSCFYFLILKIIQLVFYFGSAKLKSLQYVYNSFQNQTKWWTLVFAIIDINLMRLSFCCFLQVKMSFFFRFNNKVNYVVTSAVLFAMMMYALWFYGLICNIEMVRVRFVKKVAFNNIFESSVQLISGKKSVSNACSQILLTRSRPSSTEYYYVPFLYESFCIVSRNFFRAFIHGFLLDYYPLQIALLALNNICCIVLVITFQRSHTNRIIFTLCLAYYTLFFIFDSFFLIKQSPFSMQTSSQLDQNFSFCVLLSLVVVSLLLVIVTFIVWSHSCIMFLKHFFCNNKVTQVAQIRQSIKYPENKSKRMRIGIKTNLKKHILKKQQSEFSPNFSLSKHKENRVKIKNQKSQSITKLSTSTIRLSGPNYNSPNQNMHNGKR